MHLGELLLQLGLISHEDLIATLSELFRVEYINCTRLQPPPATLQHVPAELARKFHALPIKVEGKTLVVVMADPQNFRFVEELHFKTGLKIAPRLGLQSEITAAIDRLYVHMASTDGPWSATGGTTGMEFISASSQERNVQAMREMQSELQQKSKTTPAVQMVASIISAAAIKGASDIHIEPQQDETPVPFRVDGVMRDYQHIPRELQHTVSRIKILSDMDIAERRVPLDGRFLVRIGKQRIDFRVSTLPTQYGEKLVLRLLESDAPQKGLESLGSPTKIADELRRVLGFPQGMLLVTGRPDRARAPRSIRA